MFQRVVKFTGNRYPFERIDPSSNTVAQMVVPFSRQQELKLNWLQSQMLKQDQSDKLIKLKELTFNEKEIRLFFQGIPTGFVGFMRRNYFASNQRLKFEEKIQILKIVSEEIQKLSIYFIEKGIRTSLKLENLAVCEHRMRQQTFLFKYFLGCSFEIVKKDAPLEKYYLLERLKFKSQLELFLRMHGSFPAIDPLDSFKNNSFLEDNCSQTSYQTFRKKHRSSEGRQCSSSQKTRKLQMKKNRLTRNLIQEEEKNSLNEQCPQKDHFYTIETRKVEIKVCYNILTERKRVRYSESEIKRKNRIPSCQKCEQTSNQRDYWEEVQKAKQKSKEVIEKYFKKIKSEHS